MHPNLYSVGDNHTERLIQDKLQDIAEWWHVRKCFGSKAPVCTDCKAFAQRLADQFGYRALLMRNAYLERRCNELRRDRDAKAADLDALRNGGRR